MNEITNIPVAIAKEVRLQPLRAHRSNFYIFIFKNKCWHPGIFIYGRFISVKSLGPARAFYFFPACRFVGMIEMTDSPKKTFSAVFIFVSSIRYSYMSLRRVFTFALLVHLTSKYSGSCPTCFPLATIL